jgi:hypothetical protein
VAIINVGIDTIRLEIEGIHEVELDNRLVLKDKTIFTSKGNTRITIRNPNGLLSDIEEMLFFIKELEHFTDAEVKIVRVDIAADSNDHLKDNSNLIRLLLECINVSNDRTCEIFRTVKGINKDCNIKLSDRRTEITCYNRTDKKGSGKSRLEKRNKDIKSKLEHREVLENEIKNYIKELKNLVLFIEKVEDKYVKELTEKFNEEKNVIHGTFSGFVESMNKDGFLMTANILKGLMKKIGIKQNSNTFAKNFRRTRTNALNFVSKNELKKLTKELEKNLKLTLKE